VVFLAVAAQTKLLLNLLYGRGYKVGVMQFNSFGDIFSQTLGLLCNSENQRIPSRILLVPTFKKINKEKFNKQLYREIKSIIEANTTHRCLKLGRITQILLIRLLDFNSEFKNSTFVSRKLITSAQLNLSREDLKPYLNLLKCRDSSFQKFHNTFKKFGISENYAVVAIRSASFTKSSEPLYSERIRSSKLFNFSSTLRYLSSKYDNVIVISDQKLESNIAGNILQYKYHPIRSQLMDFMIPANAKLLVGNLYGVTDTRLLRKSGKYIAIDVPLLSLHWNIYVDFAMPKTITSKKTNLPIDISQIYDIRYFDRHAYTDACENSFNFIDNSEEEICTFVKEVLEEKKYLEPVDFEEVAETISIENSYLNALGKAASLLYGRVSSSGLDTPIEAKISSKFHHCFRQ
jgi:putative glycosyltransferase (TIGR04372 family)